MSLITNTISDSLVTTPNNAMNTRNTHRKLIVLIPAVGSHSSTWKSFREKLEKEDGYGPTDALWFPFDYGEKHGNKLLVLPGRVDQLARRLRNRINEEWNKKKGEYDEVILVGHSLGGLIARKVYLLAAGAVPGQEGSLWGNRVTRIILFASPNRGTSLNWTWWAKPLSWALHILQLNQQLLYEDVLIGSNFLTNLRIDWIRHFDATRGEKIFPIIFQFLGDRDNIISVEDSKDIHAFSNTYFREIADATHSDLYRLDTARDPDARYAYLRDAFTETPESLQAVSPTHRRHSSVKHVVFLLHGIRASNVDTWIKQLRGAISNQYPKTEVISPTYGYFTAWDFTRRNVRTRNIRFFQDAYTESLAEHPNAKFNIVAHSNGTYMLGYSLLRTPGMRFENVVLAGSVLPQSYPWLDILENQVTKPQQIVRIMNHRANRDWPVALLCNGLQALQSQPDIGPSGFAGFFNSSDDYFHEVAYYNGDHGVALNPDNHQYIIDFIFGKKKTEPPSLLADPGYFRQLSNAAPYVAWWIVIGVITLAIILAYLVFLGGILTLVAEIIGLVFLVFLAILLLIVQII